MQHDFAAAALRLMGRQVVTLALPDTAPVQVLGRFGLRMVTQGPVWGAGAERLDGYRRLARAGVRLVNALEQADGIALGAAGYRQVLSGATLTRLDVQGDLRSRMHRKWRTRLMQALADPLPVTVSDFDIRRHDWLLGAEARMRRERRYVAYPQAFVAAFAAANPGCARVFEAREDDAPVAAMLVLLHHPTATYHMGWSGPRGRARQAHRLLLDRIAADLAQAGYLALDLGTIDTENAPDLARFKLESGASPWQTGGTWVRLGVSARRETG